MLGRSAAQLGVGLLWHINDDFGMRTGFFEDIRTETAPDFGVEIALIIKRLP
jgi:hypothetical protein